MNRQQLPNDPKQALIHVRILWAALLAGPLIFMIAVAVVISSGSMSTTPSNLPDIIASVAFGMLLVMTPAAYIIRSQIYKRHWQGDVIAPPGYITGNMILFAMFEGIALLGLVGAMVQGAFGLSLAPSVIAMALLVINFPTGKPMFPPDGL